LGVPACTPITFEANPSYRELATAALDAEEALEPTISGRVCYSKSGKRAADYVLELFIWMFLLAVFTVIVAFLISYGGHWIGEALAKQPTGAWILDGTQGSQRPVIVVRTTDYWLEWPVQERGHSHGQQHFTPVGPAVIHSYDEGPLRLVWVEDFGVVTK